MANVYITKFIEANQLQKGDVIIVENLGFGLQSQFVPFLGYDAYRQPMLAADTEYGVRFLNRWEIQQFFQELNPQRIKRFQGSDTERNEVVQIARENLNEDTFNLVLNWTENGRNKSSAGGSGGWGWGAAIAALGIGLLIWGLTRDNDDD